MYKDTITTCYGPTNEKQKWSKLFEISSP